MKPRWLETLEQSLQAGTHGFILVFNTTDRVFYPEFGSAASLKFFLASYLASLDYAVASYSTGSGLQEMRPPNSSREDSSPFAGILKIQDSDRVLPALASPLRSRERKVAILFDYADHLAPSSQGMGPLLDPRQQAALQLLHSWGNDDAIKGSENLIILISHENQVSDLLRRSSSGYRTIQVELPSEEERREFIQFLTSQDKGDKTERTSLLSKDLSTEELVRGSGGLRLADIEAIFRLAFARGQPVSRDILSEKKAQAIKEICQDLVEVHECSYGFEAVAGLCHAIEYFDSLKWRIQKGAADVPQAILLAGVPGSGKSFLVSALAKELGYPCLVMRNVREKWVGASERNLELVLWVAETLAPCIVWIDEMDQALGQRTTAGSADAGTSERMLSRIWEFMGSMRHRGKILWLATTNRPDLLDAATLDRFPVVIPFLHPTPSEVVTLLPVVARQIRRQLADSVPLKGIAQLASLQLPTVRALQEVVAMAAAWADQDAGEVGTPIGHTQLAAAATDFKPNYDPLQHEFIALTAIRMTSFQSLLPWRSRCGRREDVELPQYLMELVDDDGMVDTRRLEERLRDLEKTLGQRGR